MAHLMENILGGMSNPHSAQTVSYVNIAGAGKGKVWRRIKEPRGAEQGVLDVLQGPFTL